MARWLSVVLGLWWVAVGARAEPLEAWAAAEVQGFVADVFGRPAVVAALVVDGEVTYVAGGSIQADPPVAPTPDTVFEIGSITKAFTGLLFAQMVRAGEVGLDDPVTGCAPRAPGLPGGVTLRHLSTHRSGLGRLPADLFNADDVFGVLARRKQPYADYPAEALFTWWRTAALNSAPGARWAYSNAAVALLGTCLGRAAGRPWGALIRDRLLAPLGMRDTWLVVPAAQRPRFATGHGMLGGAEPPWLFGPQAGPWAVGAMAPAGALRSTARDLVRLLRAATGEAPPALAPAFAEATRVQARYGRGEAEQRTMGLGWVHRWHPDRPTVIWHNGGTAGFRSYLGYLDGTRSGVVLLVASAGGNWMALAHRLMAAVAERTP